MRFIKRNLLETEVNITPTKYIYIYIYMKYIKKITSVAII